LSRFANGNTVSARHHYGVEATGVAINTVGNFSIITTDEDRDTSIFNSSYEGYAVKGVISNADVNNGNHSNKIKVAFKNSDFLLQPGSYKYTFRAYWSLRETAAYSETPYTVAFRKTKTYLTGKLKVTAIVGFIAFAIMCMIMVADLLTGWVGTDLVINEFVYDSFVWVVLGCFGISGVEKFAKK